MLSELTCPEENPDFLHLQGLKEHRLLLKSLFIFIPLCIFGALSMFFPVIYAMFPVQESETCICSFIKMDRDFLISLSD